MQTLLTCPLAGDLEGNIGFEVPDQHSLDNTPVGPGNIHGFVLVGKSTSKDRLLLLKHQLCPPFPV